MSENWISGANTGNDRLVQVVGEDLAEEIYAEGYTSILAQVSPEGVIIYFELNDLGQIIGV